MVQGNILSHTGTKFMLPIGTTRDYQEEYEEVTIPPARPVPPKTNERLIAVSELDPLARGSFPVGSHLNRVLVTSIFMYMVELGIHEFKQNPVYCLSNSVPVK